MVVTLHTMWSGNGEPIINDRCPHMALEFSHIILCCAKCYSLNHGSHWAMLFIYRIIRAFLIEEQKIVKKVCSLTASLKFLPAASQRLCMYSYKLLTCRF